MNLKDLLRFKAAGGGGGGNLLRVAQDNEKRMSDNYQHWTTENKTVVIDGAARGGYFATLQPGTYTFSWASDFADTTSFAMRIWKDPTDSSLGTLIVDKNNTHEQSFTIEGADQVTVVCGFYCNSTFGQEGRVLSNLTLVKTA